MKRSARGIVLVAVAAVLVVGLGALPAGAHAAYKESDPPDRSTVSAPPSSVWAEFTEPVQEGARLDVFDPCGTRVDRGDASANAYRVTVSMAADKAGTYRVAFRVVSTLDGHPTSGEFIFTSSGGNPCEGDDGSAPARDRSSGDDDGAGSPANPESAPDEADPDRSMEAGPENERGENTEPPGAGNKRERMPVEQESETEFLAAEGSPAPAAGEDIPLDWLLVGLGLAALIGAVAGQIYASIIGPDRKRRRQR